MRSVSPAYATMTAVAAQLQQECLGVSSENSFTVAKWAIVEEPHAVEEDMQVVLFDTSLCMVFSLTMI